MRHRRATPHANHERWLVSYADFITLLFAFFVVLYSSSQMDKGKMARLAAAIGGAFHQLGVFQGTMADVPNIVLVSPAADDSQPRTVSRPAVDPLTLAVSQSVTVSPVDRAKMMALKRQLESMLASDIKDRKIVLRPGPEGLVISLSELGFFDSGSADIRVQARPDFARIARIIVDQQFDVRIEGHTDNVPIHSPQFESNWDLSTARAVNLAKLLIAEYSCGGEHLAVAGYGEYHPIASNETAEGRQQNRRVDLVIIARPDHSSAQPALATERR